MTPAPGQAPEPEPTLEDLYDLMALTGMELEARLNVIARRLNRAADGAQ